MAFATSAAMTSGPIAMLILTVYSMHCFYNDEVPPMVAKKTENISTDSNRHSAPNWFDLPNTNCSLRSLECQHWVAIAAHLCVIEQKQVIWSSSNVSQIHRPLPWFLQAQRGRVQGTFQLPSHHMYIPLAVIWPPFVAFFYFIDRPSLKPWRQFTDSLNQNPL